MQTETKRAGATNSTLSILGGIGAGAALMYFLDPHRGTRRRNLVRDKIVHAGHAASDALGPASRDIRNRAQGVAGEARSRFTGGDADDAVIVARVRSSIGRAVSHPGAITVTAEQGRVILGGPVLEGDLDPLLEKVRGVRGVRTVDNRLEVHATADNVPGLQGDPNRTGEVPELAQEKWTPAVRLLATATGRVLMFFALRRRGAVGLALGAAGLALSLRSSTNMSARRLTGIGAGRRAVDVQKTITINAPVEQVFQYFSAWENWPQWMSHVREVRRIGSATSDTRTHWEVDGPAGVTVEWDAITTQLVPNEVIAWKSVEDAAVGNAGIIRFTPSDDGATTIDVQMSYNPPAGALGHVVAKFFGRDPKQQMDDDLARLKTTIETGTPPHDAASKEAGQSGRAASGGARGAAASAPTDLTL